MSWGSLIGSLGTGLSNVASSGLGQAAIGAGLGYGADRLAGGKGGTGALLGGIGGLMNYGSGAGGNLYGEGAGGFDTTALGGLFGQGQQAGYQQHYNQVATDLGRAFTPAEATAIQSGYEGIGQGGLMSQAGQFGQNYGDLAKMGGDISSAYGDIRGANTQRDLAKSEIDYRNRVAALNEAEARRISGNQAATQQSVSDAFSKSKLKNYYSA